MEYRFSVFCASVCFFFHWYNVQVTCISENLMLLGLLIGGVWDRTFQPNELIFVLDYPPWSWPYHEVTISLYMIIDLFEMILHSGPRHKTLCKHLQMPLSRYRQTSSKFEANSLFRVFCHCHILLLSTTIEIGKVSWNIKT